MLHVRLGVDAPPQEQETDERPEENIYDRVQSMLYSVVDPSRRTLTRSVMSPTTRDGTSETCINQTGQEPQWMV